MKNQKSEMVLERYTNINIANRLRYDDMEASNMESFNLGKRTSSAHDSALLLKIPILGQLRHVHARVRVHDDAHDDAHVQTRDDCQAEMPYRC